MSLSPMGFLNRLFDKFNYTTDDSEIEKKISHIPLEALTDIGEFWAIPGSIRPSLHCEIQRILYLQANNKQYSDPGQYHWLQQIDVLGVQCIRGKGK